MVIYIALIILSVLYILIAIIILVFFLSTIQTMLYTRVPFIPVPKEVLPNILKALDLKDESVMYDLGCGDARVLIEATKASKSSQTSESSKSRFVGIERVWLPLVLAKLRVWRNNMNQPRKIASRSRGKIKIYNRDFFETDLSNATHVFLYLLPKIMDKLLPKLERELKPGARVVSCSFKFSNKKEKEIINLNRNENQLARELYVYEF